jgi:hypothetical protein
VSEQVERSYSGTITVRSFGEDDGALYLDPADEPLALMVATDVEQHGSTVTVSYWITDEPRTLEQLVENEVKKLAGAADAEYDQAYSDITGYLWTDEKLKIGGHDLLGELEAGEGRWCMLVIKFGER